MVVLGDLNARVENEVIDGIVGQHGVCSNSWFKENDVYKYT